MSAKSPPSPENLTFEKALAELEAIVARMEDGKLPLEESLAAYQRGAELIKLCEAKLTDAQARIAILEGGELRDLPRDREAPSDELRGREAPSEKPTNR